MLSLNAWAKSDIGRKRANNEDAYFMCEKNGLFMVADGMGGHRGGHRASELAIETASREFLRHKQSGMGIADALKEAMDCAARAVHDEGKSDESLWGMGTTLSALALAEERAFIAHIGDTRIYCLRSNMLYQITSDHSLVNEQVQAGIMSKEQALVSTLRNIITRALGQQREVRADFFSLPVEKDDKFLLCSDGLNTMLSDNDIKNIINNHSPNQAIQELINQANLRGGEDNITAILLSTNPE